MSSYCGDEKHKQAYGSGIKEAKKGGLPEKIFHNFGDAIRSMFPSVSEQDCYEEGYHNQMSGKT
jgi:hypothetical protein